MTLSIIAICVVFSCLLILYFIYSILGKICSKDLPIPRKSADKDETVACTDSDPVPNAPDADPDIKHDLESGIITIVPHTNWTHQFSSASGLPPDAVFSANTAFGLPAAAEGPDSWVNGPSVAQAAPPAGVANDGSAGGSWSRQACPPSDTSEGGARRMQVPAEQQKVEEYSSQRSGTALGNCATLGIIRGRGPSGGVGGADISQGSAGPLTNRKIVYAPLPGIIVEMKVGRGQEVKRGDRIAVLEAMKMENDILAPIDGTITNVFVFKGDSVLEGAKIAEIE